MAVASFRFYAELNDFLPTQKKEVSIEHAFTERASIKDTIEALGIPHPEVDCIEVNGKYVDFSYTGKGRIMKNCNSLLIRSLIIVSG